MNKMFYNCSSLTSVNLSNFNFSSIINIESFFYNCISLISIDLFNISYSSIGNGNLNNEKFFSG